MSTSEPAGVWRKWQDFPPDADEHIVVVNEDDQLFTCIAINRGTKWFDRDGLEIEIEEWLDESPEAKAEASQSALVRLQAEEIEHLRRVIDDTQKNIRKLFPGENSAFLCALIDGALHRFIDKALATPEAKNG